MLCQVPERSFLLVVSYWVKVGTNPSTLEKSCSLSQYTWFKWSTKIPEDILPTFSIPFPHEVLTDFSTNQIFDSLHPNIFLFSWVQWGRHRRHLTSAYILGTKQHWTGKVNYSQNQAKIFKEASKEMLKMTFESKSRRSATGRYRGLGPHQQGWERAGDTVL